MLDTYFTLTKAGATKLKEYLNANPIVKAGTGDCIQIGPKMFLKDAVELHVEDINNAFGTNFKTGTEAYQCLGKTVTLGVRDYGCDVPAVGIDLRALDKLSKGQMASSRRSELAK
jgi:hypothetical protein